MVSIPSLPTVWSQQKSIEATLLSPDIERCDIGEKVIHPVAVRRVLLSRPLLGDWEFLVHPSLNLAFVIDTVESNDSLQEYMKLGVAGGISGNFEKRLEHIYDDLLEIVHQASCLVHIVQTRYLDQPSYVGRKELIIDDPRSKLIPFIDVSTVNGNAPFDKLVLA